MKISILTIAPQEFDSFLETPLLSRNIASGLLQLDVIDLRDFAPGSFRKVDDSPYGGGAGMLLRYQPLHDALLKYSSERSHSILLAPCGKPFRQKDAHRLAEMEEIVLFCGHYEGFDYRFYEECDEILSIGDYILCGGELPSMVIVQALLRVLEGSMKKESVLEESFENRVLEYPQYTKPYSINGKIVPDILLSGDHQKIREYRQKEALAMSRKYRPDLLKKKSIEDVEPYLKAYIEEKIFPCYSDYEKGHNEDHIRKVIENSFELIEELDVDVNMVYCIAAYHDIGIRYGRKDHHLTSALWLYEDKKLSNWFSKEERLLMKEAIEDHRASSDHEPRSIYGKIVAEADRDIEPYRIIERCVAFEKSHHPDADRNKAYELVMDHLEEKYSCHGYLKLWLPCKKNMEGLETLRGWMESGEVKEIVEQYLDNEKKGTV